MTHYKLRLTSNEQMAYQAVKDMFKCQFEKKVDRELTSYMYCMENNQTKPGQHMHFYLVTSTKQKTIRSRFRVLGFTGNGAISLKVIPDPPAIEYMAYMMKEGHYKIYGFDEDTIQEAEGYYAKQKADFEALKKARRDKRPVVDKIQEAILQHLATLDEEEREVNTRVIEDCIIDYHLDNNLLIRKFQCEAYYITLCARMLPRHLFNVYTKIF